MRRRSKPQPHIYHPKLKRTTKCVPACRSAPELPRLSKTKLLEKPESPKKSLCALVNDIDSLQEKNVTYYTKRNLANTNKIIKTPALHTIGITCMHQEIIKKCSVCCCFCDFSSHGADAIPKSIKKDTLKDILVVVSNQSFASLISNDTCMVILHMISLNLFRPMPSLQLLPTIDTANDMEWTHLKYVYQIFETLLEQKNLKISDLQVNSYCRSLFRMIYSPDIREQSHVAKCLSLLIKRWPILCQYCTKRSCSFIVCAQYDIATQRSLSCFLTFYKESFSFLKPNDMESFFKKYILPLFMIPTYKSFHQTLLDIINIFITKFPALVDDTIAFMIKRWPITDSTKVELFLNVIDDLVSNHYMNIKDKTAKSLFNKICQSINDPTNEISQQALFMVIDKGMISLLKKDQNGMMEKIYLSVLDVSHHHWCSQTRFFANDIIQQLQHIDPHLSTLSLVDYLERERSERRAQKQGWQLIKSFVNGDRVGKENIDENVSPRHKVQPPEGKGQYKRCRKLRKSLSTK